MALIEVNVLVMFVMLAGCHADWLNAVNELHIPFEDELTWLQMEFSYIKVDSVYTFTGKKTDGMDNMTPQALGYFRDNRTVSIKTPRYAGQFIVDNLPLQNPDCVINPNAVSPNVDMSVGVRFCNELRWDKTWNGKTGIQIPCQRGEALHIPLYVDEKFMGAMNTNVWCDLDTNAHLPKHIGGVFESLRCNDSAVCTKVEYEMEITSIRVPTDVEYTRIADHLTTFHFSHFIPGCWQCKDEMSLDCGGRSTCRGTGPRLDDYRVCASFEMPTLKDKDAVDGDHIPAGVSINSPYSQWRICCDCAFNLLIY